MARSNHVYDRAIANQIRKTNRIRETKKNSVRGRASSAFKNIQHQPSPQGFGTANSVSSNAQQQSNPFNFGSQSQSFGGTSQSVSNAGQNPMQSASFPPFGTIAPPNTSFNFASTSNAPFNNPFAAASNNTQPATASSLNGGFKGSIFNIPPSTPAPADQFSSQSKGSMEMNEAEPAWANGVNPFTSLSGSNNGASNQQQLSQPAADGSGNQDNSRAAHTGGLFGQTSTFSNGSQSQQSPFKLNFGATQSNQFMPNLFGSTPSQEADSGKSFYASSDLLLTKPTAKLQAAKTPKQTASNIFGSTQSTQSAVDQTVSNAENTNHPGSGLLKSAPSSQASPNLFRTTPSQPRSPASNPFSSFQSQTSVFNPFDKSQSGSNLFSYARNEQKDSGLSGKEDPSSATVLTSNIFDHLQQSPRQSSSDFFGQTNSNLNDYRPATSPTQDDADRMSTTPATSPAGQKQSGQEALASLNAPTSPSPQGSTGGLFGNISRKPNPPSSLLNDQGAGDGKKAPSPNLFARTEMSQAPHEHGSKESPVSTALGQEAPKHTFTGFGRPVTTPAHTNGKQPDMSDSETSKDIFAGITQPSTNAAQLPNGEQSPSLGNGALKSRFPGFGQRSAKSSVNSEQTTTDVTKQATAPSSSQSQDEMHGSSDMLLKSSPFKISQPPAAPTVLKSFGMSASEPVTQTAPHNDTNHAREANLHQAKQVQTKVSSHGVRLAGAPPKPPQEFNAHERQESVTGYRLRAFDAGFKKLLSYDSVDDLLATAIYYQKRREAIVNAADYPTNDAAGNKRKSPPILDASDNTPAKKVRLASSTAALPDLRADDVEPSINGANLVQKLPNQQITTQPLLHAKRDTEQSLTPEDPHGATLSAKRTRSENPAPPTSLLTPNSSRTSNLFKSIVDSTEDGSQSAPSPQPPSFQFPTSSIKAPTANMSLPVKSSATSLEANPFSNPTTSQAPTKSRADNTAKPTFKPPTFGTGTSVNFMSQFQQLSKQEEQNKKRKAKDEDLDSDEDEAEWERRYEEKQQAKKKKYEGVAKGTKYILGKGFVSSEGEQEETNSKEIFINEDSSAPPSRASSVSVLDQPVKPMTNGMTNIFGHISPSGSGAEGSKTGDADDEDTASEDSQIDEETPATSSDQVHQGQPSQAVTPNNVFSPFNITAAAEAASLTQQKPPASRSLFERMEKDKDGNLVKETPPTQEQKASSPFSFNFSGSDDKGLSKAASPSLFPESPMTIPVSKKNGRESHGASTSPGDHTWKTDSPIKFGTSSTQPEVQVTSATPPKPSLAELFGKSPATDSALHPPKPLFNFSQSTGLKAPEVGFGISITKPNGSLAPSDAGSNNASRATSPGISSNAGTISESGGEDAEEQQEQIDLASGGPGEEDEEVMFQVKAKAIEFDATKKGWITRGVGPVRVLRHNESDNTRILMRQEPSGKIILNAALLKAVTYKHSSSRPKAIEVPFATDSGKLASYILTVGKEADAVKLASILEENKLA